MIFHLVYFGVFFSLFLVLLFLFFWQNRQRTVAITDPKVPVSILIAARNEAHSILRCLESINDLDYPKELLEVLIGDDESSDDTWLVVSDFIKDKPNFRLISIGSNLGSARGKSNVLAHLTREATSGYFFITDADIELPRAWIETMLAHLKSGTGIVTGITTTSALGFFARMQGLDWLHALGLIQIVSELGLPVTTMGNNMLVTREAYEATGGYEKMPFSITEDIQLFQQVLAKGFGFRNVYLKQVLAFTLPAKSLPEFLHQRKRWMKGSMHLPLYMKGVLILYASFYVVLIPFLFSAPLYLGLSALALKWVLQSIFLLACFRRLHFKLRFSDLIYFELYQAVTSVLLLIFYYLPIRVLWKGRKY